MESTNHTAWCLLEVRSPTANMTETLPPECLSYKQYILQSHRTSFTQVNSPLKEKKVPLAPCSRYISPVHKKALQLQSVHSVEKNDPNDQGSFSAFSCSEPGYLY